MGEGRVTDGCVEPSSESGPTRAPTLVDLDEWSSLCSTGHTPNIVTGAFLRFLQEHFADPLKIENAALRDNIFTLQPGDTTEGLVATGILIDPIYKWNPQNFSQRPAIYIKRGGVQTQRLGIADGLTVGLGRNEAGELKTYEGEYHVVGVAGSHSIFCIGRSGAEAEVLASEVFREVCQFGPVLRRDLKLKRLTVTEVTEVNQLAEYDQHFAVAVVLGWYYFERWLLKPIAPWLKSIAIDMRAE